MDQHPAGVLTNVSSIRSNATGSPPVVFRKASAMKAGEPRSCFPRFSSTWRKWRARRPVSDSPSSPIPDITARRGWHPRASMRATVRPPSE